MKNAPPLSAKKPCRPKRLPHHYRAIAAGEEGHPIDLVIQREVDHAKARERVLTWQKRLLDALGPAGRRTFLALEELRNEISADREERYFDVGYERGLAYSRARGHRVRPLPEAAARLVADIHERVLRTRPRHHALFGLVECLQEVAFDDDEDPAAS